MRLSPFIQTYKSDRNFKTSTVWYIRHLEFISTVCLWSWYSPKSQAYMLTCIHSKLLSLIPGYPAAAVCTLPQFWCRPDKFTQPYLGSLRIQSHLLLWALAANTILRDENMGLSTYCTKYWVCIWLSMHMIEYAAVWVVFVLFHLSSEAFYPFQELLFLSVGRQTWMMQPQWNKIMFLFKNCIYMCLIQALSSQKKHNIF